MIQYLRVMKRIKQTEKELMSMSDKELQDIGLTRGDIPGILFTMKGELLNG